LNIWYCWNWKLKYHFLHLFYLIQLVPNILQLANLFFIKFDYCFFCLWIWEINLIDLNILFLFLFLHLHLYHLNHSLLFKTVLYCFFKLLKILMIDQVTMNSFSFNICAIRLFPFHDLMIFILLWRRFFCILNFRKYQDLLQSKFCSYFCFKNFMLTLDLFTFREDLQTKSKYFQLIFDHLIFSQLLFNHQVTLIENWKAHKFPKYSKFFVFYYIINFGDLKVNHYCFLYAH
jgi:hypothetical protein